jgi:hypothetical protein
MHSGGPNRARAPHVQCGYSVCRCAPTRHLIWTRIALSDQFIQNAFRRYHARNEAAMKILGISGLERSVPFKRGAFPWPG